MKVKKTKIVTKEVNLISTANKILHRTKQMEGEALEYLDKLFNNSGISKPTLPNRL